MKKNHCIIFVLLGAVATPSAAITVDLNNSINNTGKNLWNFPATPFIQNWNDYGRMFHAVVDIKPPSGSTLFVEGCNAIPISGELQTALIDASYLTIGAVELYEFVGSDAAELKGDPTRTVYNGHAYNFFSGLPGAQLQLRMRARHGAHTSRTLKTRIERWDTGFSSYSTIAVEGLNRAMSLAMRACKPNGSTSSTQYRDVEWNLSGRIVRYDKDNWSNFQTEVSGSSMFRVRFKIRFIPSVSVSAPSSVSVTGVPKQTVRVNIPVQINSDLPGNYTVTTTIKEQYPFKITALNPIDVQTVTETNAATYMSAIDVYSNDAADGVAGAVTYIITWT